MKLSVVIPAYNEEACIKSNLEKFFAYLKKQSYQYEVIVVDDGSIDGTFDIADSFEKTTILKHQKNLGKGAAIKTGILAASGDYLLFLDADNATSIDHIEKTWPLSQKFDLIIGSRDDRDASGARQNTKQSEAKRYMGILGNHLIRFLGLNSMRDTQCGFKFFSRKAAREIFSKTKINRWATDVEILLVAKRKGLKTGIIPITWNNQDNSKVTGLGYLHTLVDILKIKLWDLRGFYK